MLPFVLWSLGLVLWSLGVFWSLGLASPAYPTLVILSEGASSASAAVEGTPTSAAPPL